MTERSTNTSANENQYRFDRRRLLQIAGTTPAVLLILACSNEENPVNPVYAAEIQGKLLQNAKLIPLEDLAKSYARFIQSNTTLFTDHTVLRSTFYHGLKFFGADEKSAKLKSGSIGLTDNTTCGASFCTYDTSLGPAVEYSQTSQASGLTSGNPWVSLAQSVSHESYHLDTKTQTVDTEEDFGILGKVRVSGKKRGFWQEYVYKESPAESLINFKVVTSSGQSIEPNLLEEFFAEHGRRRFYPRLLDSGLSSIPNAAEDYTAYPIFTQGYINLEDKIGTQGTESWQKFFGNITKPQILDTFHRNGDRYEFLAGVGDIIEKRSVQSGRPKLSPPDKAALGLVAITDFAVYGATNHRILFSLVQNKITPELILKNAQELSARIGMISK